MKTEVDVFVIWGDRRTKTSIDIRRFMWLPACKHLFTAGLAAAPLPRN